MLYANPKSHRSHHQGINSASVSCSAKSGKGTNSQSLSNVSMQHKALNVQTNANMGGFNSVSGESAKTSPSTDSSRDRLQTHEIEIYESSAHPND